MLYTELVIGLFKVILYGLFIIIMVRIYTLPLFAVRPMYLTARAFKKAFKQDKKSKERQGWEYLSKSLFQALLRGSILFVKAIS